MDESGLPTRESAIVAAQRLGINSENVVTLRTFVEQTGITAEQIRTLFPAGGYSELLQAAGVVQSKFRRRPSDHDLLCDIHRVALELGRIPTIDMLKVKAEYSPNTFKARFGNRKQLLMRYEEWLDAQDPQGDLLVELRKLLGDSDRDSDKEKRRQQLIDLAANAAANNGGVLSRSDFVRLTGVNTRQIYYLFPDGGWTEILQSAGIEEHPSTNHRVDDNELLPEFHRVCVKLNRVPTQPLFAEHGKYSTGLYCKRFGTWGGTADAYRQWVADNGLDVDWLPPPVQRNAAPPARKRHAVHNYHQQKADQIVYGELINFRGLQHAPINELGVVYLFGMVSRELRFLIESVQSAYPDCHGKREIKNGRWQPVRIEFEFKSRNFLEHGHDPDLCDLIVCWEDNWPESPLEVLSLKEAIATLKG